MNFSVIDWAVLGAVLVFITYTAYNTKRHTRSVADFLAANRCAGKYMLGVADGIAGLGAITIVAFFELHYKAGFCGVWWRTMTMPATVIVAMTGWVQYRFRQTNAMTMAQFMEMRYSRNFRIFAGIAAFASGIINFGIFPAVGGRFFQYCCGLPPIMVSVGIMEIDLMYAAIMFVLLGISLAFTFMGGQIAVMVTDFFQGVFCNVAFCVIAVYLLFFRLEWSQMMTAFQAAPIDASLINPANSGDTENFNATFFVIMVFSIFFNYLAWQGNQGYYVSARSPHEARIGRVVGTFREVIQSIPIVLLAVGAYTVLNHTDFTAEADQINGALASIGNAKLQSQQTVSVAMVYLLPRGMLGLFAAVMMSAFISTHDTYLHAWGSIFIQDVVMPIRQRIHGNDEPMNPTAHLRLLKVSIFGVAVFIFLFSLLFQQKQDVFMFFALTGTVYLGWAGCAIIGGLYWKYGTTAGVWVAAVFGVALSVGGWYLTYYWGNCQGFFASVAPQYWSALIERAPEYAGDKCPLTAQVLYFWSMVLTTVVYVIVSLAPGIKVHDMDRMLHRGKYAKTGIDQNVPARGLAALKMSKEFKLDDKLLYLGSLIYIFASFGVFLVLTSMFAIFGVEFSNDFWGEFWYYYSILMISGGAILTVWFAIGGMKDYRALMRRLTTIERYEADDGTVVDGVNLIDLVEDVEKPNTG